MAGEGCNGPRGSPAIGKRGTNPALMREGACLLLLSQRGDPMLGTGCQCSGHPEHGKAGRIPLQNAESRK